MTTPPPPFGDPSYALTRHLPDLGFADAVAVTRESLAAEGFGVLTEIDVQTTIKAKLDADLPPYVILGACNPPIALRALTAEPGIGVLLPCNVVVAQQDEGVTVAAVDPRAMFSVIDRPDISRLAEEVRQRLARALARVGA